MNDFNRTHAGVPTARLAATLALAAAVFSHAQEVTPPAAPPISVIEPTSAASQTPYATHGLTRVTSAQTVGAGRLNANLSGSFYKQDNAVTGTVPVDAQISTLSGALAIGLNDYFDAFGQLNINNRRGAGISGSGFGSTVLGAQVGIPMAREIPFRMSGQIAAVFGTSENSINGNSLDGYNYLETRQHNDVMVRLAQSFLFAGNGKGINIHFNEGLISSFESNKEIALVTGVGVEIIPVSFLVLGLEANSRTYLSEISSADPLWVTPSMTWRSPAFVNVNLGVDIALSKTRSGQPTHSLEPWRLVGGLSYSIDTKAGEKREAARKARQDSAQKAALGRDLMNAQQRADSLQEAKARQQAAAVAAQDSLRQKAVNDSLALARSLEEERSKRSEMEKQLLTTGLLVLDAVYFETGKTDISINSKPYLTLIAKMLTTYPKLQLEIGGHTDNVGGATFNQRLSQGRAAAVVAFMVQEAPELQGRLTAKGYAYSQPKADNRTAEGRQLNRRTELKVLNPAVLREYNP